MSLIVGDRIGFSGLRFSFVERDHDETSWNDSICRYFSSGGFWWGTGASGTAALDQWMDARRRLGINGSSPVFCTLAGNPIKQAYIREWFPRLAKKCGIEKGVHAHGLRHTFAFELANEGVPIHIIQHALGHANASITSLYISHLSPNDVIDTMKSREWAA